MCKEGDKLWCWINKLKPFRDTTTTEASPVLEATHVHTKQEEKLLGLLTNEVDPKPPVDNFGRDVRRVSEVTTTQKITTISKPTTLDNVERRDSHDIVAANIVKTFNILHVLCFWC